MREPIIRLTVLQPDPIVHVERFGGWLAQNRAMLTSVPLAQRPAPAIADVGDGVLILGGRMNVHDATQPWLPGVKRLIVEAVARDVPVLGICLGHQLIADALGGEVTVTLPEGPERGPVEVRWLAEARLDPVVSDAAAAGCGTYPAMHDDGVRKLPPGAVHLASGTQHPFQAFRVGSAIGVQFHPEASPQVMGEWSAHYGRRGEVALAMRRVDAEVARGGELIARGFVRDARRRRAARGV